MKVKIARVVLEEIELEPEELITQAKAAKLLGIRGEGVRAAMEAGRLPTALLKGNSRRYTLRRDVEEMVRRRGNVGEPQLTEDQGWGALIRLLDESRIHTGVRDLADEHEHYLYKTPKIW